MNARHTLAAVLVLLAVGGAVLVAIAPWRAQPDGGAEPAPTEMRGPRIRFALDLEAARERGDLPAEADLAALTGQAAATMRARLTAADVTAVVRAPAPEEIEVHLAEPGEAQFVVRLLSSRGHLRFAIEVLPAERYRGLPDEEDPPRLRDDDAPWQGAGPAYPATADGFDRYLADEVVRLREAEAAGEVYRPSAPRYEVVFEHERPEVAHLLEHDGGAGMDQRILVDPRVSEDQMGRPTVTYAVRADARQRFGAWTARNLRLPFAIVVDDRYRSAPIIQARLDSNVQISLGAGSRAELRDEARRLAAAFVGSPLPVVPRLLAIEDEPTGDSPRAE